MSCHCLAGMSLDFFVVSSSHGELSSPESFRVQAHSPEHLQRTSAIPVRAIRKDSFYKTDQRTCPAAGLPVGDILIKVLNLTLGDLLHASSLVPELSAGEAPLIPMSSAKLRMCPEMCESKLTRSVSTRSRRLRRRFSKSAFRALESNRKAPPLDSHTFHA